MMNEDTAQLTESFVAHEHLIPDAADVLARANEIARSYQRRRWAVRATGSAVVGAGLVAGGIAAPGWAGHSADQTVVPSSDDTSSPPADDSSYTQSQEVMAFLTSGYTYEDAQQLAQLWNDDRTINKVKAAAGLKLLEGDALPIPPSGQPESPENKAVDAFFAAGYSYEDAQTLAQMWSESTYKAKSDAGTKLMAGEPLPISPSGNTAAGSSSAHADPSKVSSLGAKKMLILRSRHAAIATPTGSTATDSNPISAKEEQEFQAFFDAGYTYDDAVKLGNLWNESNVTQVKAEAGQKLLDGDSLPVDPSGTPAPPENRAVEAFFNAGYSYDDAVTLGQMWNEPTYKAKADAGQKLLDGQTLPIQP